jgi:hypothetical protein
MSVVLAGVLLTPPVDEGPGYGGTAEAATVQWRDETDRTDGLAVYAVGFRGGSPVELRVGSAGDRTVYADDAGALRILVLGAADAAGTRATPGTTVVRVDAAHFTTGMSVQAVGQDPAGGERTLIGAVPPPAAEGWLPRTAPWAGLAATLVAAAALSRKRRRR